MSARIDLPPVSAALLGRVTEWATLAGRPERCPTCKTTPEADRDSRNVLSRWCLDPWHTPLSPGERVAIWATEEEPNGWGAIVLNSGPYIPLRPGGLHAHATVAEVLPIVDVLDPAAIEGDRSILSHGAMLWLMECSGVDTWRFIRDISDQLPYCDWTPGRQAVRFTDIEETP